MKITIFLLGLFLSWTAQAAFPPQFDAEAWRKLVDRAGQSQERMDTDYGQYRILSRLSSQDPNVTHQADYFSAVGYPTSETEFSVSYISAVSEFWKIDEQGIRDIDQRIYQISWEGNLFQLSHNHLVEDADGRVLTYESVKTGEADDPAELQNWADKLSEWTAEQNSTRLPLN